MRSSSTDTRAGAEAAARRSEEERNQRRIETRHVAGKTRPRRLLLCLDGVPHEMVEAARGRGMFEKFGNTARLLSPFPTMTNVALSTMLCATAPLGYESLYFNRDERRLCGGVRKYIGWRTPDKIPSSYMDELDYQEPLPFEFLVYVAPETIWRADMRRFRERFRAAPPERDFFAFLKGTDGLLHIRGPKRLDVALRSLDHILREIRAHCGSETEIVLFSDHGMNLEENRRINLQTHLKSCGFEVADDLRPEARRSRRSVAVPAFGLCGYAALYCAEETDAAHVAAALSTLKGVDFSIRRDGPSSVAVEGARGAARILRLERSLSATAEVDPTQDDPRRQSALSFRYEQLNGDPLQLAPTLEALRLAGQLDPHGFASDAAWLAHTATHIYPDAPANLYDSLYAPRVRHTADILISLEDGYYYGDSLFSRLARLRATHGNALKASSTAFLMSTHRDFPAHVRAAAARPFLRD